MSLKCCAFPVLSPPRLVRHRGVQGRGQYTGRVRSLQLEVDRHASPSTVLAEYDLLAREPQTDRGTTRLDVALFPITWPTPCSPAPTTNASKQLARHEATGHLVAVALTALAPWLTPGKLGRSLVAGLIPTPAEPTANDMQTRIESIVDQTVGAAPEGRRVPQRFSPLSSAGAGRDAFARRYQTPHLSLGHQTKPKISR